jgi:hypothetical protein
MVQVNNTVQTLLKLVGKEGTILTGVGSITVPIKILDARFRFGRVDLLVVPLSGNGEAWVDWNRIGFAGESLPWMPTTQGEMS